MQRQVYRCTSCLAQVSPNYDHVSCGANGDGDCTGTFAHPNRNHDVCAYRGRDIKHNQVKKVLEP